MLKILISLNIIIKNFVSLKENLTFKLLTFIFLLRCFPNTPSSLRVINSISQLLFAKLFIIILIVQMITLANLYGIGLMGNPNSEFKSFISDSKISNNFSSKTIHLVKMNGKIKTLMQAYIPNYVHFNKSISELKQNAYIIINQSTLEEVTNQDNLIKLGEYRNWKFVQLSN